MQKHFQSIRGFTLVEIMIVVVIIGLLAAMAIPAFQRVRASSQNKAITTNLRQLAVAADQYFLENGVSSVATSDLVGTNSSQYIKQLQPVVNETYVSTINEGQPVTAYALGAGGKTITYTYDH